MKLKLINVLRTERGPRSVPSPLLGIPILVGLTPAYVDVEIEDIYTDEEFKVDTEVDLVGISCLSLTSLFAYKISQKYREIGKKVVMGGIHVSVLPEEALKYCDSVVVGEAELVWKTVIDDFIEGKLKTLYRASYLCSMDDIPNARLDLLDSSHYQNRAIIHASRGCPYNCKFCAIINFYNNTFRMRPVNKVIDEIKHMKSNGIYSDYIFFSDDNLICNKNYLKKLLNELKELNVKWGTQCNLNIADNEELLQLMKSSGCVYLYLGIETITTENAKEINKSMNDVKKYEDQIKKIRDAGIIIQGGFILGLDGDTEHSFEHVRNFVQRNKIDLPAPSLLTPFVGTELYKEMDRENRIISKDWSKYDLKNVVFKPKLMSPELLQKKYNELISDLRLTFIQGLIDYRTKLGRYM